MVDLGNETQNRGDHERGTEAHEGTAAPNEDGHVGGNGKDDLAGGAQQGAHAEVLLPADDGTHHATGDHEGASHEGVDHVGELDIGGGGAEVLRQSGCGERKGAVIARGAHLGQDQNENGEKHKLLGTLLLCHSFSFSHVLVPFFSVSRGHRTPLTRASCRGKYRSERKKGGIRAIAVDTAILTADLKGIGFFSHKKTAGPFCSGRPF